MLRGIHSNSTTLYYMCLVLVFVFFVCVCVEEINGRVVLIFIGVDTKIRFSFIPQNGKKAYKQVRTLILFLLWHGKIT